MKPSLRSQPFGKSIAKRLSTAVLRRRRATYTSGSRGGRTTTRILRSGCCSKPQPTLVRFLPRLFLLFTLMYGFITYFTSTTFPAQRDAMTTTMDHHGRPSNNAMAFFVQQLPKITSRQMRKFKCKKEMPCLVHLHIYKTGGTSLDSLLFSLSGRSHLSTQPPPSSRRLPARRTTTLQQQQPPSGPSPPQYHYVGNQHFDWSYIDGTFRTNDERNHVAIILMLRDPVERAISHFRHVQSKNTTRLWQNISMAEFFASSNDLLQYRAIWQDGQAAVSWLTGTHIATDLSVPSSQLSQREILAMPHDPHHLAMLLHIAADRLEQTLWFGILEDVERSMELLQYALHLPNPPPKLPHLNQRGRRRRRKRRNQDATNDTNHNENDDIDDKYNDPANDDKDDEAALRSLLYQLTPQDRWLYEYGTMLFDARYTAYRANSTIIPPVARPPLPAKLNCWSTRFNVSCPALDEYIANYNRRHGLTEA
jgi:hypothetical protein